MKRILFLLVVFFPLVAMGQYLSTSQSNGKVIARGVVLDNEQPVDGAIVDVYAGGKLENTYVTRANGKFKLNLALHKDYLVVVSQFGKVTKKVEINTEVPENERGKWEIGFNVDIFDVVDGIDLSVLDKPVAKIRYNRNGRYFDYNMKYSRMIAQQLRKLNREYERLAK